MNMERERGRPFFACIFTRRKQREIISILPAGDFEKWCSSLSLSLEGRLLPSNEILLSFASFCRLSIHPSTHPSLPSLSPHSTPFTARQGYPIPHSSHPLYPLACQISPSKANPPPLLLSGDLPCEVASTQFPNCPRFHAFFLLHVPKIGGALNRNWTRERLWKRRTPLSNSKISRVRFD